MNDRNGKALAVGDAVTLHKRGRRKMRGVVSQIDGHTALVRGGDAAAGNDWQAWAWDDEVEKLEPPR